MKNLLPHRILACIMAAQLLAACSSDGDETMPAGGMTIEEEEGAVIEVPIGIEIESAWNIDVDADGVTRAAPPGGGSPAGGGSTTISEGWVNDEDDLNGVNEVRIVAFRRQDTNDGGAPTAPFVYDKRNDRKAAITTWEERASHDGELPDGHRHRCGTATLKKMVGYEYRVIALAYCNNRAVPYALHPSYNSSVQSAGEQNWFTTNEREGLTIEEFAASINIPKQAETQKNGVNTWLIRGVDNGANIENANVLSRYMLSYPQLFWGYCRQKGSDDDVIHFSTNDSNGDMVMDKPLTGLLYRGMAKIEVRMAKLSNYYNNNNETDNITWIALIADMLSTAVGLSSYDDFLLPPTNSGLTDGTAKSVYSAIGFAYPNKNKGTCTLTTWVLPTKTHLALRAGGFGGGGGEAVNGHLNAANISYSDMGTGIISPDVVGNVFYFRRNHKYVLNIEDGHDIYGLGSKYHFSNVQKISW